MGSETKIQWTDHTFNPWIGCTRVHAGCVNCYAEKLATKRLGVGWGPKADRRVTAESTWKQPLRWARAAAMVGERHRVFCASLADVLDERAPKEAQARFWDLIRQTARWTHNGMPCCGGLDWQLLTKRPWRWELIPEDVRPLVSLGTSASNQETWDGWVDRLAAARGFARLFVSLEPMVGPVEMALGRNRPSERMLRWHRPLKSIIGWVIVGGESGQGARPFDLAWARSIRDQCKAAGVPFFLKQLGAEPRWERRDEVEPIPAMQRDRKGGDPSEWPADLRVRQFPEVDRG